MRGIRSILIVLAATLVAAGCAQRPLGFLPVANAPAANSTPVASASGIDGVIYGPTSGPMLAPASGPGHPNYMAAPPPMPTAYVAPARGFTAAPAIYPTVPVRPILARPELVASAAVAPSLREQPYTLDSGDRLRVVVFGQDGLSNSYLVDASGHIAMPLIGSVLARGATTDELSGRIAEKLRQGFIREPHVAVEIEAYRPFFILGEVTAPGQYPYVADMTVETAVAIAGGFGPRAFRRTVTISRTVNGLLERMTVPITYLLRPGDTVNVQERWF